MAYTKLNLFWPTISYVYASFLAYPLYTEKHQIWSYTDIEIICHHFKLDRINNMDRMHMLGTDSSSVILCQTK